MIRKLFAYLRERREADTFQPEGWETPEGELILTNGRGFKTEEERAKERVKLHEMQRCYVVPVIPGPSHRSDEEEAEATPARMIYVPRHAAREGGEQ